MVLEGVGGSEKERCDLEAWFTGATIFGPMRAEMCGVNALVEGLGLIRVDIVFVC
jgi:hypothetical protein